VQRILGRGEIESLAQRAIQRVRLPDRAGLFSARARRLQRLSENHAIGEYLRLMAVLADAQQAALARLQGALAAEEQQMAQLRQQRLPPLCATELPRGKRWRDILGELCGSIAARPELPAAVRSECDALSRLPAEEIEAQADILLAARHAPVDVAAAPFLMAALQVHWVHLASRLADDNWLGATASGSCPVCAALPVASIVHADERSQGHRYLHCSLCATEWHMVRVTCSQCQQTKGISYQSIQGGPEAVRAECCEQCRTYRKILYQEKDRDVEPVADDLASLALDLLLSEAGYHRGSGNPLLWQQ
jgi:FdhE protein